MVHSLIILTHCLLSAVMNLIVALLSYIYLELFGAYHYTFSLYAV